MPRQYRIVRSAWVFSPVLNAAPSTLRGRQLLDVGGGTTPWLSRRLGISQVQLLSLCCVNEPSGCQQEVAYSLLCVVLEVSLKRRGASCVEALRIRHSNHASVGAQLDALDEAHGTVAKLV